MKARARIFALMPIAFAILFVLGLTMLARPVKRSNIQATEPIVMRIDVNSADRDTLSLLPRIGPGIAQRIIDDRRANGPFQKIDDMTRVPMVGEKTVAAIKPWVELGR